MAWRQYRTMDGLAMKFIGWIFGFLIGVGVPSLILFIVKHTKRHKGQQLSKGAKTLKRILNVMLFAVVLAVVGYFIYTGVRL